MPNKHWELWMYFSSRSKSRRNTWHQIKPFCHLTPATMNGLSELCLKPKRIIWQYFLTLMYAIMHLNLRQDGSILALGFGSTTRPSDWRVRLDKKPTRCLTSAYLVILKREVIHFQVHGIWAAASWVQIGGGVNLRQVDAQNCSMSRFYLLLAVMRLLDLFWVK